MNQYEITKSNPYAYGSVFAPEYKQANNVAGLSAPSGRWGCMIPGTTAPKGSIEATYCNIYEASNKWAHPYFPWAPLSESYEYADVAAVFNMYIKGVRLNECPEWYPVGNPPTNKTRVDSEGVVNYVTKRLTSQLSKYTDPKELVRTFFYIAGDLYKKDLEKGTAYVNPTVLWPLTYDDRVSQPGAVDDYYKKIKDEAAKSGDQSIFSGANDFLSNILTLIVIGGAVYFLAPIIFSKR